MEYDLAICRAFAYKLQSHTSDRNFAKLRKAFPMNPPLPSLDSVRRRIRLLSGFRAQQYHCCINSCCAFTGPFEDDTLCPYCKEPRYDTSGNPRKLWSYLPFIPRLIALAGDPTTAQEMKYRSEEFIPSSDGVSDIFDGLHYQSLRTKHVVVGDETLPHKFFADDRDIALGLSTDGFSPFKRRKTTAWPLILFNYNLGPEIRFHVDRILALGIVPGPKKPLDMDSFMWPAIVEFLKLMRGVNAFDGLSKKFFSLRAYLIAVFGDIPAISMLMRMKGHNGISPCRMCGILGLRIPDSRATTHYVPLDRSRHPNVINNAAAVSSYKPTDLPLRTHDQFMAQAREVQSAPTVAAADRLSKQYGIKGVPALSQLSSLSFPACFPYDFMHLVWENLIPNLVLLWTGKFKGLDEGQGGYELGPTVWEAIGAATVKAGDTIPSAYGPRVPNLSTDSSAYVSAEMWSFWTLYIAPVVLRRRFRQQRYYDHFVRLVRLLHLCLQFDITEKEIDTIEEGFNDWVSDYERYVTLL
jgi:hypothetical protein